MLIRIFVYGTLKPGECNYHRYCHGKVTNAQPAIARGQVFYLAHCGYPAMLVGLGDVRGVVLSFSDPTMLTILDRLEGYHPDRPPESNEYNRQQIEAFNVAGQSLGVVWAYLMRLELIDELGGVLLPEGVWNS